MLGPVATDGNTTATSVMATAERTAEWLGSQSEVAVPVFQRHYRWDVERCRRLLGDVRAAGVAQRPHFIGSILATIAPDEGEGIVLIDGQQRVTTLTLLIAAVRKTLAGDRRADGLRDLLVHPAGAGRTRLRPHEGQQDVLASIVFDSLDDHYEPGVSNYEDVYRFFLAEVQADAADVCDALYRLEHVFITLAPRADAQQVFESLNSTGAPLRDHELVHNYVLMGLTYEQQIEIEREHWRPIEANTGEFIDQFFRDYLTQRSGREDELRGEHGIYGVFRSQFPQLSVDTVRKAAAEWASYSEVYGELLDPDRVDDDDIRTRLKRLNTFGTATYPIVMAVCHDYRHGRIDRNADRHPRRDRGAVSPQDGRRREPRPSGGPVVSAAPEVGLPDPRHRAAIAVRRARPQRAEVPPGATRRVRPAAPRPTRDARHLAHRAHLPPSPGHDVER